MPICSQNFYYELRLEIANINDMEEDVVNEKSKEHKENET